MPQCHSEEKKQLLKMSNQCSYLAPTDPQFAQNLASAYNYALANGNIQNKTQAFANGNFVCFQDPDIASGCLDVTKIPVNLSTNLLACATVQSEVGPYQACFMSSGTTLNPLQVCQSAVNTINTNPTNKFQK